MSNALFPNLPLICAGMTTDIELDNIVSHSASGRRFAIGRRLNPIYKFKVPFTVLRGNNGSTEYATTVGFFNARRASLDNFLFKHPTQNTAINESFGVGDGVTKDFYLTRLFGGFVEPVGGVMAATLVAKVNGTVTTGTLNADFNKFSFVVAPANGAALTWSGSYYFRCSFVGNTASFKNFTKGLYSVSFELTTENA